MSESIFAKCYSNAGVICLLQKKNFISVPLYDKKIQLHFILMIKIKLLQR